MSAPPIMQMASNSRPEERKPTPLSPILTDKCKTEATANSVEPCTPATAAPVEQGPMMTKVVHVFGGDATTAERLKELLGGKGSNIAEMASIGLPVPPGFTTTTDVCTAYYANGEQFPAGLVEDVAAGIAHIEGITGKIFGDAADPLLVSVRSGARVSDRKSTRLNSSH